MTFAPTAPWQMCTVHQSLFPSDRLIKAACSEVGCVKWRNGWTATYDEATVEGRQAIALMRSGRHGRTFRELPRTGGTLVAFRFESGQRCFAEHRTKPELFVVHNPRGREVGSRRIEPVPRFWSESVQETYLRRQEERQRRS